jgi:hypothetical protein
MLLCDTRRECVVEDLTAKRLAIIERHEDRMIATDEKLLEIVRNAIRAQTVTPRFGIYLLNKLALGSTKSYATAEMTGFDRLGLARAFIAETEHIADELMGEGQESLRKSIDEQLGLYREEIVQTDEELKMAEEEATKETPPNEKGEGLNKAP